MNNKELYYAIRNNNLSLVKEILEQEKDKNILFNDNQYSMIQLASEKGHIQIVKYLLTLDLDINHQDYGGNTALIIASFYEQLEVILFLLKQENIKIDVKNNRGLNFLQVARKNVANYFTNFTIVNGQLIDKNKLMKDLDLI